ncbi:MAG: PQQ-like beta-propeller repeat protein [Verrucomicrobiales bacterium]|nr:PQQ-like beta-propeller repeat protein [Verrucomicrobiales bacterium]
MNKGLVFVFFLVFQHSVARADDWPQWMGKDRDGIWKESGIVEKFPENGPEVIWRCPIGSGYAGPAVAGGKVFVTDRQLGEGAQSPDNPFQRGVIPGIERVLCLDEISGKILWTHQYPGNYTISYAAGPRVTPTVDGDSVYTLGAEGMLLCLNTHDGGVVWEIDLRDYLGIQTPVWGFAGAPLVYGDLLICLGGGEGSTAIAFQKSTGKEVWRSLTAKEPGYCPPRLIHHGGKDQVIIWHPESVNSLNPLSGEVYWTVPWQIRSGLSIPVPRLSGDRLFLTAFYNGATMLKLKSDQSEPEILWQSQNVSEKRTTHLNSIMPTPVLKDGLIFGTCSYGEFRCLDQATGDRIWESMQPSTGQGRKVRWFNIFLTPHKDRYFLFTEKGDLLIAKLSRQGYEEIDRTHLIEPNGTDMRQRPIVWSHPAYANGSIFVRNDSEIIRVSLRAD